MPNEKYALEITMRIRKTGPNGEFIGYGDVFEMSEKVDLGVINFLELTKVLGQFHDVATEIQMQHAELERENGDR